MNVLLFVCKMDLIHYWLIILPIPELKNIL